MTMPERDGTTMEARACLKPEEGNKLKTPIEQFLTLNTTWNENKVLA